MNPFEIIVLSFFLVLPFYFLPTLIAVVRRHRNLPALIALNVLLGWTFIGWVGALVWSLARGRDGAIQR